MFGTANVALVSGVGSEMGRSIALGLAQGRVDAFLAARRRRSRHYSRALPKGNRPPARSNHPAPGSPTAAAA
jgi:NAD(P)-dependent dehydrogenase (short-subunit alcohol dehydrogenase family)